VNPISANATVIPMGGITTPAKGRINLPTVSKPADPKTNRLTPEQARQMIAPKFGVLAPPTVPQPTPIRAAATAKPQASSRIVFVTQTVQVKNPNYKPTAAPTGQTRSRGSAGAAARRNAARAAGVTTNIEPEFIPQEIIVRKEIPVPKPIPKLLPQPMPIPLAPQVQQATVTRAVVAAATSQTLVQQYRNAGMSPSEAYAAAAAKSKDRIISRIESTSGEGSKSGHNPGLTGG
jgi:hypothetical protein